MGKAVSKDYFGIFLCDHHIRKSKKKKKQTEIERIRTTVPVSDSDDCPSEKAIQNNPIIDLNKSERNQIRAFHERYKPNNNRPPNLDIKRNFTKPNFNFAPDPKKKKKMIGGGSQGKVYRVYLEGDRTVLTKELNLNGLTEEDKNNTEEIIKILITNKRDNIVNILDYERADERFTIYMEDTGKKQLTEIFNEEWFKEKESRFGIMAEQVLKALCSLEFLDISHNDIKPNNIISDVNFNMDVIDFTSSLFNKQNKTATSFTPSFMAPEVN